MSKKDKIDKSIAFHQAIMLALYVTFVGLVGSIIYKKFCGLELGSLALLACVALFLVVMIAVLHFMILKKLNELKNL